MNPILLAGFGAYGHTPAIISGGIPKEEVGAYPSGVINRFFDANVVISVPVAYIYMPNPIAPEFQLIGTPSAEKTVRAWE